MDYQFVRVLAGQPVIDIGQSDVDLHRFRDRFPGGTIVAIGYTRQFAYGKVCSREPTVPRRGGAAGIFATDSLAERVMQAGCLGMEFSDPARRRFSDEQPLIRTARGVERRSPATRAAHLRLVRRMRAADPRFGP